jgi:hypothetical protein
MRGSFPVEGQTRIADRSLEVVAAMKAHQNEKQAPREPSKASTFTHPAGRQWIR